MGCTAGVPPHRPRPLVGGRAGVLEMELVVLHRTLLVLRRFPPSEEPSGQPNPAAARFTGGGFPPVNPTLKSGAGQGVGPGALRRGIELTQEGTPVLLEFITEKATDISRVSEAVAAVSH